MQLEGPGALAAQSAETRPLMLRTHPRPLRPPVVRSQTLRSVALSLRCSCTMVLGSWQSEMQNSTSRRCKLGRA